jgi:ligand-binding SRPBCC domain-containing protein
VAVFKSEVIVNELPEKVLKFFLNPHNLVEISLPKLQLTMLDAPDEVQIGTEVQFQVTHFGQDLPATHEVISISEDCITERQIKGVMKEFEQERRFAAADGGGCRVTSTINFTGPGGLIGAIMTEDRIKSSLNDAFEFQNEALQKRFGAPA